MVTMAIMATDSPAPGRVLSGGERVRRRDAHRARARSGVDRLTVMLFSVAAVLAVLAVLAHQLPATSHPASSPVHILRKIYRTTIIESIPGPGQATGTSVSQSVSSSGSAASAPAPTTRTS
jgi:hypothetical protein